ncbi:hypothetical protein HDU96_000248 [Phlyctochytrium bullatum]|nr:hypothetical protein HDU96_000248 [Phlyctochytrium bullatum]
MFDSLFYLFTTSFYALFVLAATCLLLLVPTLLLILSLPTHLQARLPAANILLPTIQTVKDQIPLPPGDSIDAFAPPPEPLAPGEKLSRRAAKKLENLRPNLAPKGSRKEKALKAAEKLGLKQDQPDKFFDLPEGLRPSEWLRYLCGVMVGVFMTAYLGLWIARTTLWPFLVGDRMGVKQGADTVTGFSARALVGFLNLCHAAIFYLAVKTVTLLDPPLPTPYNSISLAKKPDPTATNASDEPVVVGHQPSALKVYRGLTAYCILLYPQLWADLVPDTFFGGACGYVAVYSLVAVQVYVYGSWRELKRKSA